MPSSELKMVGWFGEATARARPRSFCRITTLNVARMLNKPDSCRKTPGAEIKCENVTGLTSFPSRDTGKVCFLFLSLQILLNARFWSLGGNVFTGGDGSGSIEPDVEGWDDEYGFWPLDHSFTYFTVKSFRIAKGHYFKQLDLPSPLRKEVQKICFLLNLNIARGFKHMWVSVAEGWRYQNQCVTLLSYMVYLHQGPWFYCYIPDPYQTKNDKLYLQVYLSRTIHLANGLLFISLFVFISFY